MLNYNPDYAVKFGRSVGRDFEDQKAFPFFYNFVNSIDDDWDATHTTSNAANISYVGPTVAPGARVDHPIRLDPDFNFKLLSIKYTAYELPTIIIPGYKWYDWPGGGWFQEQADYQTAYGTPLSMFALVSLAFQGPDGRYLYGGHNTDPLVNASLYPLPIEIMQGYDFGYGQMRTPYLLPSNGVVMVSITNMHPTKTLVFGGVLAGMKVTV